jgi:hypothetical protein
MPISVVCPGCGKALKVPDQLAGKNARCPACKTTFAVQKVGGGVGPTVYDPSKSAAAKAQREKEVGRVSISWLPIFGIVAIALVCAGIGLFIAGPKKVWNEWEQKGEQANYDVKDVVSRGLKAYMSEVGAYNPRKSTGPEAREVMFFRPTMVMSMPDAVEFKGGSTEGPFEGQYHPKTGEVEATVTVGAHTSLLTGQSKGGSTIQVTGRVKSGKVTAEVNGKNAVIVMPPKTDD